MVFSSTKLFSSPGVEAVFSMSFGFSVTIASLLYVSFVFSFSIIVLFSLCIFSLVFASFAKAGDAKNIKAPTNTENVPTLNFLIEYFNTLFLSLFAMGTPYYYNFFILD